MKLLPGFLLLSEVTACGKLPDKKINFIGSRPAIVKDEIEILAEIEDFDEIELIDEVISEPSSVTTSEWYPLNDGVMGGLSKGTGC